MHPLLLKDNIDKINENIVIAGLDIGKKYMGVAISNPDQSISTPLTTVKRTKFTQDMAHLEQIFADYEVKLLIIGLPVNMDASINSSCDMIYSFIDEMNKYHQISDKIETIMIWDERLSSMEAKELFKNDLSNKKAKEKGITDKLAAHIILQSALDYINSEKR